MANNVTKYGFRWAVSQNGRPHPNPIACFVATTEAFNVNGGAQGVGIGPGDVVTRLSTGGLTLCDGTEGSGGAVSPYGIVVGVDPYYDAAQGFMVRGNVLPSATNYGTNLERQSRLLVVPANWGIWEVDVDENTTATTLAAYQAFIGENASHINTGASGATRAAPKLDISTHNTTNTLIWRIVGVSTTQENQDFSGTGVKLFVQANVCQDPAFNATGI